MLNHSPFTQNWIRNYFSIPKNHRDANFQPTDIQNDLLLAAPPTKVIVNPYHAKLLQSQKDQAKAAAQNSTKITIPEAHAILENIHRTLNGVRTEKPPDIQLDKIQEIITADTGLPAVENLKISQPTPQSTTTQHRTSVPPNTASQSIGANHSVSPSADNQSSLDNKDSDDSTLEKELAGEYREHGWHFWISWLINNFRKECYCCTTVCLATISS